MAVFPVSRRKLLVALGSGAAIAGGAGLWLGIDRIQNERFRKPVDRTGFSPNVYLGVLPDGEVQIWLTRSEMGQGISTALPMLIAEELDADWARIRVHQAQAGGLHDFGQLFTAASSSVSSLWIELRRAGALAREMLVAAAAERWQITAGQCHTSLGSVYGPHDSLTYGELVEEAADQWVPIRPALKTPETFSLIGTSPPRLDLQDKVTGATRFGSDMTLPGMVRAVIERPPAQGQTLLRLTDQAALEIPGVLAVFPVKSGVAVVANSTFAALKGRMALEVEWSPVRDSLNTTEAGERVLARSLTTDIPALQHGKVVPPGNGDTFEATYQVPYLAHACMEPMNCTVHVTEYDCQLWVGTQAPNGARQTAASVAGMPLDKVTVNVTPLGGGFGRRAGQDFVAEAVEIGIQLRRPVQLFWTREDDLAQGAYREAAAIGLSASTIADQSPGTLRCRIATGVPEPVPSDPGISPLMGLDTLAYRWEGLDVSWGGAPIPLPVTIWRSVGYSYNIFAVESFMDELAEAMDCDSLELRERLLPAGSTLARCLEGVAKDSRWHDQGKRAVGLASYNFGSTSVAMAVELASAGADWTVRKVWCVVDCGIVVHRNAAEAQIEGGIVFGLSAALYESVKFADAAVTSRNFHSYKLARMPDTPEISVRFLSSHRAPSGLGEASTPGVAPAVANALYRLTGDRLRSLPLKA